MVEQVVKQVLGDCKEGFRVFCSAVQQTAVECARVAFVDGGTSVEASVLLSLACEQYQGNVFCTAGLFDLVAKIRKVALSSQQPCDHKIGARERLVDVQVQRGGMEQVAQRDEA